MLSITPHAVCSTPLILPSLAFSPTARALVAPSRSSFRELPVASCCLQSLFVSVALKTILLRRCHPIEFGQSLSTCLPARESRMTRVSRRRKSSKLSQVTFPRRKKSECLPVDHQRRTKYKTTVRLELGLFRYSLKQLGVVRASVQPTHHPTCHCPCLLALSSTTR